MPGNNPNPTYPNKIDSTPSVSASAPIDTKTPADTVSSNVVTTPAKPVAPSAPISVIGPLPVFKTITITFVPDWTQEDMRSPLRAASLCVLLGPANTLPQQAVWSMEFNLYATDKLPSAVKIKDEEPISKGQRALLWYDGKPFPKYKNCLVLSKCRLSTKDELKTHSIVLRTHGEERDPNALVWVRKRGGPKRRKDLSYLKVTAGHHYYLNITFAAGSSIAQLVGSQSWRPIIYLYTKRQKKGIDEIQYSGLFTNFTTNWAQGVEPNVDERELKLAAEALQKEAEEDAEDRAPIPSRLPPAPVRSEKDRKDNPESSNSVTGPFGSINTNPNVIVTKPEAYANPLPPTAQHFFSIQPNSNIPVEWADLESAINSKPLASIVLPSLEKKPFNTDFLLYPIVERFVTPAESTLAQALCAIEGVVRAMATDSTSPHSDVAKHLLNCFSAVSQLPGWIHVQAYIHNPQLYFEQMKVNDKFILSHIGSIKDLQFKGQKLIRSLCQRIDWVLELQRKAGKPFDPEFYVKVIAADRAWANEASGFMKEAEEKVTEMLSKNPQKFHAFREFCRKGIRWPHSDALRKEIERAGFVFRPMMIKRDRCQCEKCGVEVSGWRPWHNPWLFHNSAKHPPSFYPSGFNPQVAATLQPSSSSASASSSISSALHSSSTNKDEKHAPSPSNPNKI